MVEDYDMFDAKRFLLMTCRELCEALERRERELLIDFDLSEALGAEILVELGEKACPGTGRRVGV
jgi:hypothetical protein